LMIIIIWIRDAEDFREKYIPFKINHLQ
jgi:hypothetical protein